jgi:predicted NAD/FAD-binding protein
MTKAAARIGGGRRRIAVVGTGISGLLTARLLCRSHDVTVYEGDSRIGGHTHTVDVEVAGEKRAVDTGFIVFNDKNYPGLVRMLSQLGVGSRPTTMSFSVHCERTKLEYCGSTINQLFAQRRNLVRPSFWGMVRDILRFHREAPPLLASDRDPSMGEVLEQGRYGRAFVDHYIVPMAAAIWSAEPQSILTMPARFLIQFFENHGMLQVDGRPQWRTVLGGSRSYLEPLAVPFRDRVLTNARVARVTRGADCVRIEAEGQPTRDFDAVVMASHSDQSLRMLADASASERSVLAAVRYQKNDVVLHTDESLLPDRKLAWAAWNYRIPAKAQETVSVSYCMNHLQGFDGKTTYVVTLNQSPQIDPKKILRTFVYDHPIFDRAAVDAQKLLPQTQGENRVWFCGAWCGNGFHEDGVQSALAVCRDFGLSLDDLGPAAGVAAR